MGEKDARIVSLSAVRRFNYENPIGSGREGAFRSPSHQAAAIHGGAGGKCKSAKFGLMRKSAHRLPTADGQS